MLLPKPRAKREWVALERFVLDPRLQLRSLPGGLLYDEATVAQYEEALERGEQLPPLEACEETVKGKTTLWLFAGFHRHEAHRRRKTASVECLVYPGSFLDARLWALSENSRHGKSRTPADCQKAFDTLINAPTLLNRVMESAREYGGVQRAIAAACGLSHGIIGPYLERAGLRADRESRKLVPIAKPAVADTIPGTASPTPAPPPARASEPAAPPASAVAAIDPAGRVKDVLQKMQADLRSLGRGADDLLGTKWADLFRQSVGQKGFPLETREVERREDINDTRTTRVEVWPALQRLQDALTDLAAAIFAPPPEPEF